MSKIIIARLSGGIGNQLFVLNYINYLSDHLAVGNVFYDKSPFCRPYFFPKGKESYSLDKQYGIALYIDQLVDVRFLPNFFAKLLYRVAKFNTKKLNFRCLPFLVDDHNYIKFEKLKKYRILFLFGVFSDSRILSKGSVIDQEYIFSDQVIPIKKCIQSCESVSIHIRGGQYIELAQNFNSIPTVTKSYYIKAINEISKKIENPKFIVFSNDFVYAKEILKDIDNSIFLEKNLGSDLEQFLLMSMCKHNIISNSTFSWWAAILNKNSQKIVISPKSWAYKNHFHYEASQNLPLRNWIIIEN